MIITLPLCRRLHRDVLRTLFAVGLVLLYAWQTHAYLRVWQSDSALWVYAYSQAPLKPRTNLFMAAVLVRAGDRPRAIRMLFRARAAAQQPWIPPWDRRDTARAVAANLRALHVSVLKTSEEGQ